MLGAGRAPRARRPDTAAPARTARRAVASEPSYGRVLVGAAGPDVLGPLLAQVVGDSEDGRRQPREVPGQLGDELIGVGDGSGHMLDVELEQQGALLRRGRA